MFQALPLLALIDPVEPVLLLKFITEFSKLSEETKTGETKKETPSKTFLPYNKMSSSQKDLVDTLLEENEDFTQFLAIQAVNELGEDTEFR